MTKIADDTRREDYVAAAAQTIFPYSFELLDDDDIAVYIDGTLQTKTTHYTVSGVDDDTAQGGNVTLVTPATGGEVVLLNGDKAIEKLTDFDTGQEILLAAELNDQLSAHTIMLQQLRRDINRCIRSDLHTAGPAMQLPSKANRLGKFLRFADVSGDPEMSEILVAGTVLSQSVISGYLWPQSADEDAALVTAVNQHFYYGHIERYQTNTTPGTTDMTVGYHAAVAYAEQVGENGLVLGEPGAQYYFGVLAGDAIHTTVSEDIEINWRGARLTITGTDGAFTGCTFTRFLDCRARMHNYTFEDLTFSVATSTSRGVIPVLIANALVSTSGHIIGPAHVVAGQSWFTCTTTDETKRASNIQFQVTGTDTYYGYNCANNGDNVRGSGYSTTFNRLWFLYGVDDHDVVLHGGPTPSATSGAGYLYATTRDTTNIKIRGVFAELNGLLRIADDTAGGGGRTFRNIDIDVEIQSYGTNLPSTSNEIIAIGSVTGAGWATSSDVTMQNIKINMKSAVLPTNPIVVRTESPSYGVLECTGIPPAYPAAAKGFTIKQGAQFTRGVLGQTLEIAVTNITQANPAVVTATGHSIPDGTPVVLSDGGGMTEIEGQVALISNGTANTFEMTGIDSTAYTAYSTGGAAHVAVKLELDLVTSAENNALKSYAIDLNARSDTSGDIAAIEDWRVHTVTSGAGILTIKEQDKLALSQVGAGSPVGAFVTGDDSELYAYMTGYATTNGGLAMTARQVW